MTTDRQIDIWRVESKVRMLAAYEKWRINKLGKRAQARPAEQPPPKQTPPVMPGG